MESDHQPLERIFKKEIADVSMRLQRMLLRLQRYNLNVKYKKGKEMFIADTLSRAFLADETPVHDVMELEVVQEANVSDDNLEAIRKEAAMDNVYQKLRDQIVKGWPDHRAAVEKCLRAYFAFRDDLTVSDELVFKNHQILIPIALRRHFMALAHKSHIGIEGCLRRMRESLFWPRMSAEMKDYVARCDICLSNRDQQPKEPLMPHDVPMRPWEKVAADLAEMDGRILLVVVDYYSNFIEIDELKRMTSASVIAAFKRLFARYGCVDVLVTDNGRQFVSEEFRQFCKRWNCQHVTSSPYHPQSNGKAEAAVKMVKRLFKKAKEAGEDELVALMDLRNTPTEGLETSPAQRFMGRRCKTLLPCSKKLLKPSFQTASDAKAMKVKKAAQKKRFNKTAKQLKPLKPGDAVRIQFQGSSRWVPGICVKKVAPRSYSVKVKGVLYRRNRRDIIKTKEDPPLDLPDTQEAALLPPGSPTVKDHPPCGGQQPAPAAQLPAAAPQPRLYRRAQAAAQTPVPDSPIASRTRAKASTAAPQAVSTNPRGAPTASSAEQPVIRRSARQSKAPNWLKDYD